MLTQDVIDKVWEEVNNLNDPDAVQLANRFARDQPELVKYIATVSESALKEPNIEDLMYFSIIAWSALQRSGYFIPKVTHKFLLMAAEEQAGKIGKLTREMEDAEDLDHLEDITALKGYPEPVLLADLMSEILYAEKDDEMVITAENRLVMLISVLTVIHAMILVRKPRQGVH